MTRAPGYHRLVSVASSVAAYMALTWAVVLAWLAIGAALRRTQLQARAGLHRQVRLESRRVLIVRPCAGAEAGLLDNLVSARALTSEAALTIVMVVDDTDDAALPVIEAACAQLRSVGVDARCEVHPPRGPNRKASMLAEVFAGADPDIELFVNVDSNVDLSDYPLDALLAPLLDADRRVGASWGPWSELRTHPGLGPRASEAVLGGSLTSFPLLCGIYAYGLVGKIWALRREALDDCEFASLSHFLGEDLEMARRLRAGVWNIVAVPTLGRARGGDPSFAQAVARFGRWMLAVRAQRPTLMIAYPLFFFATPMVLALAGLGVIAAPIVALVAAALAIAARLLVALAAQHWSGRGVGLLPAIVEAGLGDVALGLAWLLAMSRRELEWRGHRLRVEPSGQLSAAD